MKIIFICHGIGNGGAERVFTTLANYMSSHGNEIIVITTTPSNNDYNLRKGIEHICAFKDYGSGMFRVLFRLKTIRNTVLKCKPDCIVSFSASCNVQVLLSLIVTGSRIIISERTDPSRYPDKQVYRILRWILYPLSKKIIFQTDMAKDYFDFRIRRKGVIIPNPIRHDLPEAKIDREGTKALDACEIFFQNHPEYIFEIYGDGECKNKLNKTIQESEILRGRVFLKGFVSDIESKILEAKIYVSSSDYEGISNSMLEALAMGTPSICTDCPVGGAHAIIQNGVNGLLIPVGDYEAMAEAMSELADDIQLCHRLSKEAVKVRDKYSEEWIGRKWIQVISDVIYG